MDYRDLLANPYLLCQQLNERPHTYDTILKQDCRDITQITKLQKRLNKLFKSGKVMKTYVGSVMRGKVIYYGSEKDYDLIITFGRTGTKVYYCEYFKEINQHAIEMINAKQLIDTKWVDVDDTKIIRDNIKKWH